MDDCKTRYPLLLLHGLNCRDDRPVCYFGRIPQALREHGARVFLGGQDAWGTIEENAWFLRGRVRMIQAAEGCPKVNIIAHSKGGLEARHLFTLPGMAVCVASITTISTPHAGSRTMEGWTRHPHMLRAAGLPLLGFWRLLGDKRPRFLPVLRSLTPERMRQFNEAHPLPGGILCQSWGTALNDARDDKIMSAFHRHFLRMDGENDGLVSPESARWGVYRGTLENISHQDVVDSRKKDLRHFPVLEFHRALARELRERGL